MGWPLLLLLLACWAHPPGHLGCLQAGHLPPCRLPWRLMWCGLQDIKTYIHTRNSTQDNIVVIWLGGYRACMHACCLPCVAGSELTARSKQVEQECHTYSAVVLCSCCDQQAQAAAISPPAAFANMACSRSLFLRALAASSAA